MQVLRKWGNNKPTCSLSFLRALTLTSKECWLLTELCQGSVSRRKNFCQCGQRTRVASGIPPGRRQFFLMRRKQWVSALALELGLLWLNCWKCHLNPKSSKQWRKPWKRKAFAMMNGMRQMWPRMLTSKPSWSAGTCPGFKTLGANLRTLKAGLNRWMLKKVEGKWTNSCPLSWEAWGQPSFGPWGTLRPVLWVSYSTECEQDKLGERNCQGPRPVRKAWSQVQPGLERQRHWIGELGAEGAEGDQAAEVLLGCRRRLRAEGFQWPEHVGCCESMGQQHPGIPQQSQGQGEIQHSTPLSKLQLRFFWFIPHRFVWSLGTASRGLCIKVSGKSDLTRKAKGEVKKFCTEWTCKKLCHLLFCWNNHPNKEGLCLLQNGFWKYI